MLQNSDGFALSTVSRAAGGEIQLLGDLAGGSV